MNSQKQRRESRAKKSCAGPLTPKSRRPRVSALTRFTLLAVLFGAGVVVNLLFVSPQRPDGSPSGAGSRAGMTGATPSAALETPAANPSDAPPIQDDESAWSDEEKAVRHSNEGNRLLAEGKVTEAIEQHRRSLALDPAAEDAHYNLAIALAQAGKTEEAIQEYREALKILPEYAEAHNNLGNLLAKQGKFPEAIEHFTQAIQANPQSASAQNNLGSALTRQGKVAEATVHFAKAAFLMPNYPEAQFNLGKAYFDQGRLDEAIAQFNLVLRLNPGHTPAHSALNRARQKKALSQN